MTRLRLDWKKFQMTRTLGRKALLWYYSDSTNMTRAHQWTIMSCEIPDKFRNFVQVRNFAWFRKRCFYFNLEQVPDSTLRYAQEPIVAWWSATYNVELLLAIVESTWSNGKTLFVVMRRLVGSTLASGVSGRCSIVWITIVFCPCYLLLQWNNVFFCIALCLTIRTAAHFFHLCACCACTSVCINSSPIACSPFSVLRWCLLCIWLNICVSVILFSLFIMPFVLATCVGWIGILCEMLYWIFCARCCTWLNFSFLSRNLICYLWLLHPFQQSLTTPFCITFQRWLDSGFLLSDPILFLKNDIRIRSESCFG